MLNGCNVVTLLILILIIKSAMEREVATLKKSLDGIKDRSDYLDRENTELRTRIEGEKQRSADVCPTSILSVFKLICLSADSTLPSSLSGKSS